jgi:ribosomal protein S19
MFIVMQMVGLVIGHFVLTRLFHSDQ